MRYMAKTMHTALTEHYPNAAEKDVLKVRSCVCTDVQLLAEIVLNFELQK